MNTNRVESGAPVAGDSPRGEAATVRARKKATCRAGDERRMPLDDRFWAKVDRSGAGGCWLWTGTLTGYGYGVIGAGGRMLRAHRVAWELLNGPIPDGLQPDHLCRVRRCVNPAHLELVTSRENTLRGASPAAKHSRRTHCAHGHPLSGSNLRIDEGHRRCAECKRIAWRSLYRRWQHNVDRAIASAAFWGGYSRV